jgi:hypothetical protein
MNLKTQIKILDGFAGLMFHQLRTHDYKPYLPLKTWPEAYAYLIVEGHYKQENRTDYNLKHLEHIYQNYSNGQRDYLYEVIGEGTANYPLSASLVDFILEIKKIESQFKHVDDFTRLFSNVYDFAGYIRTLNINFSLRTMLRLAYRFGYDYYVPSVESAKHLSIAGIIKNRFDTRRYQMMLNFINMKAGIPNYKIHQGLNFLMTYETNPIIMK